MRPTALLKPYRRREARTTLVVDAQIPARLRLGDDQELDGSPATAGAAHSDAPVLVTISREHKITPRQTGRQAIAFHDAQMTTARNPRPIPAEPTRQAHDDVPLRGGRKAGRPRSGSSAPRLRVRIRRSAKALLCRKLLLARCEAFGFLLTEQPRFPPVWKSPKTPRITLQARLNQTGIISKTTFSLDSLGGRKRQRLRVVAVDADRKEESENCWLQWSKQPAKEGLTKLVLLIGLAPSAPHHRDLEIAWKVGHVVIDRPPPRFAARTRSALLAIDVALTPFHPSLSGGKAPVDIRKLLENVLSFGNQLRASFVRNRYGPRALTVPKRAKALAKQDPPTPCGHVGQREACANIACSSHLILEAGKDGYAARTDDRARCRNHEGRTVTACDRKSAFVARQRDPDARSRKPEDLAVESAAKTQRFIARLPIDVTPELRGRIKVTAFQRGQMVTEMPRDPRAREFPQRQGARFDGRSHRG